jgi:hypothetical protein
MSTKVNVQGADTSSVQQASRILEENHRNLPLWSYANTRRYIAALELPTLTPDDILALTQTTQVTGLAFVFFINHLLQSSYTAGHTAFTLQMNNPEDYLLRDIQGTPERPPRVSVQGAVGNWFGEKSKHVEATVEGNTGDWAGWESEHMRIVINGSAGKYLGYRSLKMNATVAGTCDAGLGQESTSLSVKVQRVAAQALGLDSKEMLVWLETVDGSPEVEAVHFVTSNHETFNKLWMLRANVKLQDADESERGYLPL